MEIETVTRRADGGFIVNGILFVPSVSGNRHFRAVQDWIDSGNTPVEAGPVSTTRKEDE